MPHRFVIADVFTDRPFAGNQLAVFPDAEGLSDRAMQAIARESNFAETTFVLPARDARHTARVRIFTPRPSCLSPDIRPSARRPCSRARGRSSCRA